MKTKMGEMAVAEIIGAILLLAMAIVAFSVIYMSVLSDNGPDIKSYATIIGKMEDNHPIFEHDRGDGIGPDSKVNLIIGTPPYTYTIPFEVQNYLESIDSNTIWNIGEKVSIPYGEPDKEIKATIHDSKSNDLVWWGTLQQGEGEGFEELGARWYFDENTGTVAHDSLNGNNGYLIYNPIVQERPKWNDIYKYNGTSSLEFHGGDYVLVNGNTVSLNFIKEISVEAYIKFPIYNYITNIDYGDPFGFEPNIIHIADDVYAIVFRNQSEDGYVKTVRICENGSIIFDIYNDNLVIGNDVHWPKICHVSDEVYMVAYSNKADNPKSVILQTLKIANNGTTGPLLGSFYFQSNEVSDYEIIKICDNLTAIIYRNNSGNGAIKTFEITNYGQTITNIPIDGTFEFETNYCYEFDAIPVTKNIYAIAYADQNRNGTLKTVEITDDGVIHQVNDSFIFDSINEIYEPDIKHVDGDTYVIAYRNNEKKGIIVTVAISNNGTITKTVNDSLMYEDEEDACILPKIIHLVSDVFIIAYEDNQQDGFVAAVNISESGLIEDSLIANFQFNDGVKNLHGSQPDIIKISDNIYAMAFLAGSYGGAPQSGHLVTFPFIDILDQILDPLNRGIIHKQDTWGIYANRTHLVATIGNNVFTAPYILDDIGWNRIVLTYDQTTLKLFCNGNEVISEPYAGFNINNPTQNIFIGKTFRGFIDHVCIYDGIIIT